MEKTIQEALELAYNSVQLNTSGSGIKYASKEFLFPASSGTIALTKDISDLRPSFLPHTDANNTWTGKNTFNDDVKINGPLNAGYAQFLNDVTFHQFAEFTDDVDVWGDVEISGNAKFDGESTFNDYVEVNANFTVDGDTYLSGGKTGISDLVVWNAAEFKDNVYVDKDVSCDEIAASALNLQNDSIGIGFYLRPPSTADGNMTLNNKGIAYKSEVEAIKGGSNLTIKSLDDKITTLKGGSTNTIKAIDDSISSLQNTQNSLSQSITDLKNGSTETIKSLDDKITTLEGGSTKTIKSLDDRIEEIAEYGGLKADLVDGKVPSSQLPSYVDDVQSISSLSTVYSKIGDLPTAQNVGNVYLCLNENQTDASSLSFASAEDWAKGFLVEEKANWTLLCVLESHKIYITIDDNLTYRYTMSADNHLVEISKSLALGETSATAYAGNKGKKNADDITALKDGSTETINSLDGKITALKDGSTETINSLDGKIETLQDEKADITYVDSLDEDISDFVMSL